MDEPVVPGNTRLPIAPSVERWRAMSPAERDAFLDEALLALQREPELMPEGAPHSRAKLSIREVLQDYFARIGKKVYLASEMPVHYPGERVFAPDLMAVLDVEDPGEDDDERPAWVVADEGRGPDLVLEILHSGSARKDLVDNVLFYAQLGIPEYFVYNRRRRTLHGYRLPNPNSSRYVPIPSRGGLMYSQVLGLDLGVVERRLRFFHGGAEVPQTRELLGRVTAIVDSLEKKLDAEAQRAEAEAQRAEAEAQRAEAEAQRAQAESARADAEAAARADLERRIAELLQKKS